MALVTPFDSGITVYSKLIQYDCHKNIVDRKLMEGQLCLGGLLVAPCLVHGQLDKLRRRPLAA